MPLKSSIVSAMRSICRAPPLSLVFFHPSVRRRLRSLPVFRAVYGGGWELTHPFDRLNGTDTSGYVPTEDLPNSRFSDTRLHVYGGSQPSIVREALRALPALEGFTFIDLGAGKGRPALVAAGFPFKQVVGVELAAELADVAVKNAEIFRGRHPGCAPVRMETADAAEFPLPAGDLVIFLYNPFGNEVMRRVVSNLETALARERRQVFVVYYNPVYGACFDASSSLRRYDARAIPYAADEIGLGRTTPIPSSPGAQAPAWPRSLAPKPRLSLPTQAFAAA